MGEGNRKNGGENMKIPSFDIDHTTMEPGIYEARIDMRSGEAATTYDIRLCTPNMESLTPKASHTLEHIIAVWLRNNDSIKNDVIYFGPMGCLTGFYLILWGVRTTEEITFLMKQAFEWVVNYQGCVPGATEKECGNYKLHSLPEAKGAARRFIKYLKDK